jgi:threonine aldolase
MQHFESDYLEGAHPKILERLVETNMDKTEGYGEDPYCESAREKIRAACQCPEAEIHFLVGGTQTNMTVIKALLRSFEGVMDAPSGHISMHEAGAIESVGHKVLPLPSVDGKISAEEVEKCMKTFYNDGNRDHMVKPGMVYISHPTELGTLYTKQELTDLSRVCIEYKLPLFMDGARLGYGLMAKDTDVTLPDIARLCDIFYIGGTKVGALFGEAVVIPKPGLIPNFFTIIKQQGASLAKGRILGIQFETLFTDDLYFEISGHAMDMAEKLKAGLRAKGCRFYLESPTNQVFIIMDNQKLAELGRSIFYEYVEAYDDDNTVIRFCTSWATQEEDVDTLLSLI